MTLPLPLPPELARAEQALGQLAARYPETVEDNPWGHRAFKVRGKSFLFLAGEADRLSVTVKLPNSSDMALTLPFAAPTGYGLGKSGWVTASFGPGDDVPLGLLGEWLAESFRAIAPKKLLAGELMNEPAAAAKKPVAAKKQPAAKKKPVAAAKKSVAAKTKPASAKKPTSRRKA